MLGTGDLAKWLTAHVNPIHRLFLRPAYRRSKESLENIWMLMADVSVCDASFLFWMIDRIKPQPPAS